MIVLANKQDLVDAANEDEISELLGLSTIKTRMWSIYKTSAVTGQGIDEAMTWLADTLKNKK